MSKLRSNSECQNPNAKEKISNFKVQMTKLETNFKSLNPITKERTSNAKTRG
jgi:hypothetical protein